MLHNVRYAGTGCHGKESHSKFLFNSTVTLVPNAHPAIVSQETFDKVQEILTSRKVSPSDPESKHPRRAASPFLLSNLVYCKCCGKKMFVRNSGKGRRKLACSTNRTRGAGACPTRPEDMEVVSTTVLRALLKKVLTEKNLRQVVQKVGEESKNFAERQDRECETINVKLEDIKTQKNNIIQAIAREGRHIPDLATYLDGLSQEQAGLEARKVGLDTERNELQAFLSDELRIIENASRVRTYLQSEERSVVISMIESFVKKVELKNGSVTIHYSIPMPPGGNGKKGWSETLPLNGDQWPMETPAGRRPGCLRPRHALRLLRRRARCRHGRGDPQTAASSPLTDNVGADDCRQARPADDSLDHPRPFHGVSDMPAPVGSHSPGPIDQVSDRSGTPRRSPAFPGRRS